MAEEISLEQSHKRVLEGTHITFEKLQSKTENGFPDRTLHGLFSELAYFEYKDPITGKLSEKQKLRIKHLRNRGFNVRVIDNDTDFFRSLKECFPKTQKYSDQQRLMEAVASSEKNTNINT